jgi:HK97 family phage prohead protease
LLWAHDSSQPIDLARISDSPKGLVTNGLLNLETPEGQKAYSNLKFKSVRGLSIGYDCLDGKYAVDQTGVRTLLEVRLW